MAIPELTIQTVTIPVADAERQGWGIQTQFADPDGNGFVLLQQGGGPEGS